MMGRVLPIRPNELHPNLDACDFNARMTERDDVRRLFGSNDPGNTRDTEYVPFVCVLSVPVELPGPFI
jgi:hypothetical protein